MRFAKDTKMYWKDSGKPAYQKTDSDNFGTWKSLQYDTNKPLKERFGFKWTDKQVFEYYSPIMNFSKQSLRFRALSLFSKLLRLFKK